MASTASGWQYAVPTDTLVAWPAVSQAVADKLQTDLPKPAGLQHLNSSSFTSASIFTVDSIFTSTYNHYRLIYTFQKSTSSGFEIRLRTAGTPGGTGTYTQQTVRSYVTTLNASPNSTGSNAWQSSAGTGNNQFSFYVLDLINPALSTAPTFFSSNHFAYDGDLYVGGSSFGGEYTSTTRDGIQLAFVSGTATGNVKIYGYRN